MLALGSSAAIGFGANAGSRIRRACWWNGGSEVIGGAMPIGAGKLIGQYGQSKADFGSADTTHKVLSLGYDYNLSKNTDVYAVYMSDKVSSVDTGSSYAAGIRLKF